MKVAIPSQAIAPWSVILLRNVQAKIVHHLVNGIILQ
jgi:hypothetical protein